MFFRFLFVLGFASVLVFAQQEPSVVVMPPADSASGYSETKPVATQDRNAYVECNVEGNFIALTFDDGPERTQTPRLLDILKQRNVKATFFVLGQNAAAHPDIVKRAVAEGHEIANHSWNHPQFTASRTDVADQLQRTTNLIREITGTLPKTMRPPYGATNSALNSRYKKDFGLLPILWTVDPLDWKHRNAERVSSQIIQHTRPGAIILAHDIHKTTVDAMPRAIDALLEKGYKFVTVSELIAMDRPDAPKPPPPAPSPQVEPNIETPPENPIATPKPTPKKKPPKSKSTG